MSYLNTLNFYSILSVWRRHFHVYRKTALYNFLPPMTEPIVYLIAFGYGLSPLVGEINYFGVKVPYIRFIASGMIAVGVLFQAFLEGAYSTFVRLTYQRTWHAQLTTPLTFADVFFGELLWASTKGFISGFLTGIIAVLWNAMSILELISLLPAIFFGGLVFGALGMLAAGYARRIDYINIPVFLVVIPMFSICGTYFPRTTLPDFIEIIADVLPLSALVDLLRSSVHPPANSFLCFLTLVLWGVLFGRLAWVFLWRKVYR